MHKAMNNNDITILNYIRRHGPVSKATVARATGITPPTVTNICTSLIDRELIFEDRQVKSPLGRPSMLLKFNEDLETMLVIHVRTHSLVFYVVTAGASILDKESVSIIGFTDDEVKHLIYEGASRMIHERGHRIHCIGLVLRGPVDSEKGISVCSPHIGWNNIPFSYILEERFHLPVYVENDVRCLATGEYVYGKGQGVANLLVLKFSYGLGASLVYEGELYRGYNESAGEIGHTVISYDGNGYVMLEDMASETAIRQYVIGEIEAGRDSLVKGDDRVFSDAFRVEPIYEAAVMGDTVCLEALDRVGRYLGVALANITNLINPERIVVSSSMGNAVGIMDPILRNVIERSSYKTNPVDLVYSSQGAKLTLLGMIDIMCMKRSAQQWLL